MSKITYAPTADQISEFGLPGVTEWFGHTFRQSEPVEVPDALAEKLARHAFFVGDGEVAPAKPKKVAPANSDGYVAKHEAGGRFVILKDGEKIIKGLNKHDADTFNALTDEEKEAKVADFLANKGDQK